MQVDFHQFSHEQYLTLYDPGALPLNFPLDSDLEEQEPTPPTAQAIQDLARDGRAFMIHIPEGDCELKIRVFIDEPIPEPMTQKTGRDSPSYPCLLKVPMGNLHASGVEYMTFPGQTRIDGESETVRIAAGNYRLQAYDLTSWKTANSSREFRTRTSPIGRFFNGLNIVVAGIGILTFVGNILVAPLVIAVIWKVYSSSVAFKTAIAVAVFDICVLIYFHVFVRLAKHFPILEQGCKAREAFEAENPDMLISLTRLDGDLTETFEPSLITVPS